MCCSNTIQCGSGQLAWIAALDGMHGITRQSQECLRLSGSNTCGNDGTGHVFVVAVQSVQLELSTKVC